MSLPALDRLAPGTRPVTIAQFAQRLMPSLNATVAYLRRDGLRDAEIRARLRAMRRTAARDMSPAADPIRMESYVVAYERVLADILGPEREDT